MPFENKKRREGDSRSPADAFRKTIESGEPPKRRRSSFVPAPRASIRTLVFCPFHAHGLITRGGRRNDDGKMANPADESRSFCREIRLLIGELRPEVEGWRLEAEDNAET